MFDSPYWVVWKGTFSTDRSLGLRPRRISTSREATSAWKWGLVPPWRAATRQTGYRASKVSVSCLEKIKAFRSSWRHLATRSYETRRVTRHDTTRGSVP